MNLGRFLRPRLSTEPIVTEDVGLGYFVKHLESTVSKGDRAAALALVDEYRQFLLQVEEVVSPLTQRRMRTQRPLALGQGAQAQQFMIDLLPSIQDFLHLHPRGSVLDVLDVGTGSGHGSNLLASLYATSELGYRLRVAALDIRDDYELYIQAACRYVKFVEHDIFDLNHRFDIVIASHVIEHVPEPLAFCRRLQEITAGKAFIVTPYKEPLANMTKGHLHSFDEEFVDQLEPASFRIVRSETWGPFMDPPYEMLIAELDPRPDQL